MERILPHNVRFVVEAVWLVIILTAAVMIVSSVSAVMNGIQNEMRWDDVGEGRMWGLN